MIDTLKTYFATYGIPEELATDGGKTYTAYETQKLLSTYGVHHRLSSVAFPHSNQRAVMQYRNTPDCDTGRSPAQVIFGRQLRDFLPAPLSRYKPQPQWLLLQEDRERALRKRALRNTESLQHGTRALAPL